LDDDVLFDAWRSGDLQAADALVRRHDKTVRRYLARRVGESVEDVTQNVWTAIARSHDRFQRRSSFRAYLLGVLRNQTYEAQRQLVRARRQDAVAETLAEPRPGAETLLELSEVYGRLHSALATLTDDARRIIELYYFERLTARALGQLLGIGERTARSRVRRATERMREAMARGSAGVAKLERGQGDALPALRASDAGACQYAWRRGIRIRPLEPPIGVARQGGEAVPTECGEAIHGFAQMPHREHAIAEPAMMARIEHAGMC
jgi:RNA polymerase sigma-70 factor (ECF subfamily)